MTIHPASACRYITVHYTASPIETAYPMADLRRDHLARGWNGVGYHRYLLRAGGVEFGRRIFEDGSFAQGAHSRGENDESVSICFEGGVSISNPNVGFDSRTPAQTSELIRQIDALLGIYGGDGLDPRKGPVVEGHRDMPGAATQCPGFDAAAWWRGVVEERRAHERRNAGRVSTRRPRPQLVSLVRRALSVFFPL